MTSLYYVITALLIGGLIVSLFHIREMDHEMCRSVQYLFFGAIFALASGALFTAARTEWYAVLWKGVYYASLDWMVLFFLVYTEKYTNVRIVSRPGKYFLYLYALADSLSMICNVKFRHVFSCESLLSAGGKSYFQVNIHVPEYGIPIYGVHLVADYGMIILSAVLYMIALGRNIKIYRKKYSFLMWICVLVPLASIVLQVVPGAIDVSPILNGLLVLLCAYFALLYMPKELMNSLLSMAVEDSENGMLCFDKDGQCVYANELCKKLYHTDGDLGIFTKYYGKWRKEEQAEELQEKSWVEEHALNGDMRTYEVHFRLLLDHHGTMVGSLFSIIDKTESYREIEIEKYNATHDYLTDIYNRERFFKEVSEALIREPKLKRLIVCIDIKDFKVINDLFGEETGDQILKRIAGLMKRDAGPQTIYARLEADRFALCMPEEEFHEEDYRQYLDELKKILNKSIYRMHGHIGVYHITDPSINISVMCDRAFIAISRIKDSYQEFVCHYTENMGLAVQREKILVGEFERAIKAGEFQMYLQPQVAVEGYGILGAEALVRWEHPVRGMISPGEFIPVFEKSGHITRLDAYIWELACRQLKLWKEQGRENLHISVNISPKDFYFINVFDTVKSLVEKYDINPANLKLEITETALMEELSQYMVLLGQLREYGFQVEIDDFGSGYSSLNTLQDLEIDVLKLDMGFLRKTKHVERSRTIMNSVIDMSKNLGLTVVTEGVETQDQVQYLTEAGCDVFQGYYFAKPMPVSDFEKKYFSSQASMQA